MCVLVHMCVGCGAFQCVFASHAALICLVSMDIANVAALLLVVPKDKMENKDFACSNLGFLLTICLQNQVACS